MPQKADVAYFLRWILTICFPSPSKLRAASHSTRCLVIVEQRYCNNCII
jgi:hypothetical protein